MKNRLPTKLLQTFAVCLLSIDIAVAQEEQPFVSPKATFNTAKQAMVRGDYESFCQCFNEDGLSLLAGSLRMMTGMIAWAGEQNQTDERSVKLAKGIQRINRHYIKSETEKKIQLDLNSSTEDLMASVRKMAEPISDHSAYLSAVFKLLYANDNRPQKKQPMSDAVLLGLKVEGELATATMRGTFLKTRKSEEPITFRRAGLTWKIDQLGSFGIKASENNSSPAQHAIRTDKKPKVFDRQGLALIHRAANEGNLPQLLAQITQGVDVNLQQRSLRGTPLHYAAEAGHVPFVRELLNHRADTEARDRRGYSSLLRAAKNGHTEIVKLLLDGGASIHAKPNVGEWTALSLAIRAKHREAAQLLLDRGAKFSQHEVFARNMRRSATRLGLQLPTNQHATGQPHSKKKQPKPKKIVLPVLPGVSTLRPIDRPDENGFSQLHRAASSGNTDLAQTLIDQEADVDVRQRKFHGTPLQYAASAGQVEMVQWLLRHKARIDATDTNGRTPLLWAASQGQLEVAQVLIKAGANVNKMNRGRWTALHYAADKDRLEVAQLLIESGASLTAKNTQGKTPLDLNPNIAPPE